MVKSGGGDIYLFCGEEDFLKEEASNKIISEFFPPESRRLNREIYNAKDDRDIFEALNTLPLFSDRRIVIIRDIEYLPESQKDAFLAYLKRPSKHVSLILQSDKTALSNKFIKAISHYAKTFLFRKLNKREVRDWIYKRLNRYKKSITKEALDLFLELKGGENLYILSKELEKLVTYKAEEGAIGLEDIVKLVGKSIAKTVFDLVEAISLKDRNTAIFLIHELSSRGKKNMAEIMGVMGWQFRRLWKAKELLAQKKSKDKISYELKIKSFSIDKFLSQVNRFNAEELKRDFKLLVETDRKIKVGHSKPEFLLEQLIMKLCSA